MSHKVPQIIRSQVARRAQFKCEYCLMPEELSFLPFQIDHIISLEHGGGSEIDNLAYSCPHCNQHKGSDLSTFLEHYQDIERLFNPRIDQWNGHFEVSSGEIRSISRIGKATVKLLRMNEPERLAIRRILAEVGLYP
ncbi:MAG: HNH endonuclease [Bacteroidetes bacterium]|nr:HNH endonuclease [Bacteroidota bacterium]